MRPLIPGDATQAFMEVSDEPGAVVEGENSSLAPVGDPNLDDIPALDAEGVEAPGEHEEAHRRLWRIVPIAALGYVYDDNVFLANIDRQGSGIINLNAGFAFELGDFRERDQNYLLFNYLGTAFFYTDLEGLDSYNPRFDLFAQYRFEPLTLQVESVFYYLDGVQRQVGQFTTQILLANSIRAIYAFSDKTSFDLSLNQRANVYPDNISSYYYEIVGGFDYLLTAKLKIGLEGIVGSAEAEQSPMMLYQTANMRLAYEATGKVTLQATGGMEFNEYTSGGEPMRMLPVFSLGAEYRPCGTTILELKGYRNVESSPSLVQQDYIATGLEAALRQGVGKKFELSLAAGFENDTYVANVSAVSASRVDNFVFYRPSLSYNFLKYLTAKVFYEYRTNTSTLEVDTWYDTRFGLEISASF